MNYIMRGIHTALEPFRYAPPVTKSHQEGSTGTGLVQRLRHRRKIQKAIRELSNLSNETLEDIGIERGNIPDLVEEMLSNPLGKPHPEKRENDEYTHPDLPYAGGATA